MRSVWAISWSFSRYWPL